MSAERTEEREPDGWLLEVRGLYGEEPHDGERWEPSHVSFREMSPRQRASIYREGRVVPLYRAPPTPEPEHVIPIHGDCGGPLVEVVARYEDGSYLRISPERLGQQPSGEGALEPDVVRNGWQIRDGWVTDAEWVRAENERNGQ